MKLCSFRLPAHGPVVRVGACVDNQVTDLTAEVARCELPAGAEAALWLRGVDPATPGMLRLLHAGPAGLDRLLTALARPDALERHALAAVDLLAPVPRPGKIVAVGRNYAEHASEAGGGAGARPRIIAKLSSSVCGPGTRVHIPPGVLKPDYEVELGVVIGRPAHAVDEADALAHVAGYTVLNDLSAREWQLDVAPPQTTFAKSLDGFCPMGPWLVTADEVPDPHALRLTCDVNGERVQDDSTAHMLFSIPRLIAYVSHHMALEPGDVLATGTPAGVGAFRQPPRWLRSGDRLRLEVERVGVLEHGMS